MSYSVNWATKVITIPKADTVLVSSSPDVRSLDVSDLWTALIDLQDDEAGIRFLDIVKNTPPHTLAGITYAREVQIINGYTLTFENGPWAVNIIGGNSNVADVVNKNQVSVNTSNSAGFVQASGTPADFDDLLDGQIVESNLTVRDALRIMLSVLAGKTDGVGTPTIKLRNIDNTKDRITADIDPSGNRSNVILDPT